MSKDTLAAAGLEAWSSIAARWELSEQNAAALAGLPDATWVQVCRGDLDHDLTQNQLLRLSALVGLYHGLHTYFSEPMARTWVAAPNGGPLFDGERPVDIMIRGGLPVILQVRHYVDALGQGM